MSFCICRVRVKNSVLEPYDFDPEPQLLSLFDRMMARYERRGRKVSPSGTWGGATLSRVGKLTSHHTGFLRTQASVSRVWKSSETPRRTWCSAVMCRAAGDRVDVLREAAHGLPGRHLRALPPPPGDADLTHTGKGGRAVRPSHRIMLVHHVLMFSARLLPGAAASRSCVNA
jgi:hypothetical protein